MATAAGHRRWPPPLATAAPPPQTAADVFSRVSHAASAQAQAANPNQQQAQLAQVPAQLAAQLAQVPAQLAALQAGQAQLAAGLAGIQAQLSNQRRRAFNAHAHAMHPQQVVPLAPLAKEQVPPAGAAAVGAIPPAGAFPATWAAMEQVGARRGVARARLSGGSRHRLACSCWSRPIAHLSALPVVCFMQLNNAQLTTLANFYGENFGQHGGGACLWCLLPLLSGVARWQGVGAFGGWMVAVRT